MKKLVSMVLIAVVVVMPLHLNADDPPPPPTEELWPALAMVAFVGLCVGGVMLLSKKTEPQYYWLMDDEKPPNFWVATATGKECQLNGWKRIGGPYKRAADAPPVHPDPTNRVHVVSPTLNMAFESSTDDGNSWTTVYQETCPMDDFGCVLPATNSMALFRIRYSNAQ